MMYTAVLEREFKKTFDEAIIEERNRLVNGQAAPRDFGFVEERIMERLGWTKDQYRQFMDELTEAHKTAKVAREARIAEKLKAGREAGVEEITPTLVVKGLRLLVSKSVETSQEELVDELLALGCNFTIEEVERQFSTEQLCLFEGIRRGRLYAMASIIPNVRDSSYGRAVFYNQIMSDESLAEAVRRFVAEK